MTETVVIGSATLIHGDCREVLQALPMHDLLLTDPPYGIGESSWKNGTRGKPFGSRVDAKNTRGTYVPPTDYGHYAWDESPVDANTLLAALATATQSVVWGGNFFGLQASSKWLVWDKLNSGDFADCELA